MVGDIPFNEESHDFWEFAYVVKGDVYEVVNGTKIHLCENDILFYQPNKPHSTQKANSSDVEIVFVSFVTTSKAMELFYNYKTSLTPSLKTIMDSLIEEGLRTFKVSSKNNLTCASLKSDAPLGGTQLYKAWLEILLVSILREQCAQKEVKVFTNKKELADSLCKDICTYLTDNIYENITLDKLCSKFSYSRSLICKKFKEYSGQSIIEYYHGLKIDEACKLLRETEHSIMYISAALNFSNPYYFSKVFRKKIGITPREYKKNIGKHLQTNKDIYWQN